MEISSGVRKGTRILTPFSLSKFEEGKNRYASLDLSESNSLSPDSRESNSPSPDLGKGLGDGVASTRIELIHSGNLVLTHYNRVMPVLKTESQQYTGEMLEMEFTGASKPLYITPHHPVAGVATALPSFQSRVSTARRLRKNQTFAERQMWSLLRKEQLGTRFRRQQRMGPFILDFYAPEVRLAIEVDGSVHDREEQKEYDNFRQELIEEHDVEFLRFRNSELKNTPEAVVVMVAAMVTERRSRFDHKVYWIPASELRPEMSVFACGQREVYMIKNIKRFHTTETVYNLQVAEDNSYATEACTVHV